jgi:hypothetical protein
LALVVTVVVVAVTVAVVRQRRAAVPRVEKVTLSPSQLSLTHYRQPALLKVEVLDQYNHPMSDVPVSFSSSAPNIVTVDDKGGVRSLFTGVARITARAGGKEDTIPVEVVVPSKFRVNVHSPPREATADPASASGSTAVNLTTTVGMPDRGAPEPDLLNVTLHRGESVVIDTRVLDDLDRPVEENLGKSKVVLNGDEIVQLQPDGKTLLATGYGQISVTVSSVETALMLAVPITVALDAKSTLVVEPPVMTLRKGESRPFKLVAKGPTTSAIPWTMLRRETSAPNVAYSVQDRINAGAPGRADVTLWAGDKKAIIHVTVR